MVDAGDFLGGDTELDALKGEFLIRGLTMMGVDAINLGEMDFLRGQAYLRHLADDLEAPFVSANIVYRESGELIFAPYRLITLGESRWWKFTWGGIRVGVFGIASNEFPPRLVRPDDQPLLVLDPFETTERMVEELRPRCDLLVALSHLGLARSQRLASSFPQIDVVVSGHGRLRLDGSRNQGSTWLVHSRSEGKFMADLAIALRPGERIVSAQAVQLPLTEEYPEERDLALLYQEYHDALKGRRAPRPTGEPLYAGAATCARCHQDQYAHWAGSAHAHALETLGERGEDHNPECLGCHTTGFAEPGGFYDQSSTPGMAGVQCESCHGAALAHLRLMEQAGLTDELQDPLLPILSPEDCRTCHDERQDPDFNADEDWPQVLH